MFRLITIVKTKINLLFKIKNIIDRIINYRIYYIIVNYIIIQQ